MIVIKRTRTNKKRVQTHLSSIPTRVLQVNSVNKKKTKFKRKVLSKKSVKILQSLGYRLKNEH